ncbi:choice-of-anchor Q domain-containing protein [Paenibacillus sp. GCM10023252]|uniref:choice-of-anchor Q domain-containing protein n=1 Tax=Paenibacillus sp. GCM10023252 TaxID=3252649 RepID=UPI003610E066
MSMLQLFKPKAAIIYSLVLALTAGWFTLPSQADALNSSIYVDAVNGSDSTGDGTEAKPYSSIRRASIVTEPGDTVYVKNGTYYETSGQAVVEIKRSGTPGYPITYKAYPGHNPVLRTQNAWNHIIINGASHIIIEGLEIYGYNQTITQAEAQARKDHFLANRAGGTVNWTYMAQTNTNGISIKNDTTTNSYPHHIIIRNNKVHDVPGGGIYTDRADYITIENNTVYNNAWWSIYANSGISIFHPYDTDNNTTTYKNIIQRNNAYNNESRLIWYVTNDYSDGNGIIVDDTKNKQIGAAAYKGKTLVTNNVSSSNGGSGIHAYSSENVDIINNTAYHNGRIINDGNIYANSSNNVKILNNIMVARNSTSKVNSNYNNTNLTYDYNIHYGGIVAIQGSHDLNTDPKFVNPSGGNFKLNADSPAIDSGTSTLAPSVDYTGKARPAGAGYDRGAYEY